MIRKRPPACFCLIGAVYCCFLFQTEKLEELKERMVMVREIFRNKKTTEFVIVTIPTVGPCWTARVWFSLVFDKVAASV